MTSGEAERGAEQLATEAVAHSGTGKSFSLTTSGLRSTTTASTSTN